MLLAIRGLGKSKAVIQQVSHDHRRPERAVIYLSQCHWAKFATLLERRESCPCMSLLKKVEHVWDGASVFGNAHYGG